MTSLVAVLLGVAIVMHEWLRPKANPVFDFLRGVNLLYFLAFVVVPITFASGAYTPFSPGASGWLWMFDIPFNDQAFLVGELYAVLGYLVICAGYYIRPGLTAQRDVSAAPLASFFDSEGGARTLTRLGLLFLALGAVALIVYARSLGGFANMMVYSAALRVNDPSSPVSSSVPYLKNVMIIVTAASYLLYAALNTVQARRPRWLYPAFLMAFALSLAVLFHQAGRLNLLTYVMAFPLAAMIKRGRVNPFAVVVGVFAFVFFTYFGKEIFHAFQQQGVVANRAAQLEDSGNLLTSLGYEFAFPWLNLGYSSQFFPTLIAPRYGADFITSALLQLPDRLVPFSADLPPTLSQVNTQLLGSRGGIPVDLVSYGIYSAGLPGIVIVCALFGRLGRVLQQTFLSPQGNLQAFGVALILWFAYRVMYGDPAHAYLTGFALLVTIPSLSLLRWRSLRARRRWTAQHV